MRRNRGYTYRERIEGSAEGRTAAAFLTERYRHSSEAQWIERIRQGLVRVDEVVADPETRLCVGQWLSWDRPGWVEPDGPLAFAVLYEDGDVLAVAKPSGLPTLPGAGFLEHTLLHQLRRYREGFHPLHRLGRHTSGVVLCAAKGRARSTLSRDWSRGRVRKIYRALACGRPAHVSFEIATPIGPIPYPPLGTLNAARPDGKSARSTVHVLEQRDGEFLCEVEIATGRPHQIRIHLAASGHPLVGDPLFGPGGVPAPGCRALPGDGGYALHAAELRFPHPLRRNEVTVRCAPPLRLREALSRRTTPGTPPDLRFRDLPWG